ncbi:hypothetical protein TKK_0014560 [Trichogramma kaykai]
MVSYTIVRKSYLETPWCCVNFRRYHHTSWLKKFVQKYPWSFYAFLRSEPGSAITNTYASAQWTIRNFARAERLGSGRLSLAEQTHTEREEDAEKESLVDPLTRSHGEQGKMANQSPVKSRELF